jgi:hypothetical protein
VQTHRAGIILVSCLIALAFSLLADETKPPVQANAYPHGITTCLEGDGGPGTCSSLGKIGAAKQGNLHTPIWKWTLVAGP